MAERSQLKRKDRKKNARRRTLSIIIHSHVKMQQRRQNEEDDMSIFLNMRFHLKILSDKGRIVKISPLSYLHYPIPMSVF